ncbi:hypothetical protein B4918_10740 [Bacillus thuringiensis]|uniref:Uncharacterized protein n=2 Tax=Bacillus thuringiensis TaxID=1428 RepID=A0A9W3XIB0_BACTU|nr:hypothetical protein B4918_10740 [Bacillus thuringiensis]
MRWDQKMTELNNQIRSLQEEHGKEKLLAAATKILGKKVPTDYVRVLNPLELQASLQQIDAAVQDVLEKGKAREEAYGEKSKLLKQKTKLDTQVKLKEAEAFMAIQHEGKSQYVIIDNQKVILGNDKMRDAYRRQYSKSEREELSTVEAELNAIDIGLSAAKDAWETAKESADLVKAKAYVQANLLKFLA